MCVCVCVCRWWWGGGAEDNLCISNTFSTLASRSRTEEHQIQVTHSHNIQHYFLEGLLVRHSVYTSVEELCIVCVCVCVYSLCVCVCSLCVCVRRPRMAIIGSREQLCIHPEVSKKETNFEKVRETPSHTYVHTVVRCSGVVSTVCALYYSGSLV